MTQGGRDLRTLLETLDPKARDELPRILIRAQADRVTVDVDALPEPERPGLGRLIDSLTIHPDAHRRVARILGEIDAK
jgi:hypothetical protein